MEFLSEVQTNTIPTLGRIVAGRQTGGKPLSEPMHIRIYASLSINDLIEMKCLIVPACCAKVAYASSTGAFDRDMIKTRKPMINIMYMVSAYYAQ